QQAGQTTDVSQQPPEGRWGRYRLSVVLWMASIASYLWLIEAWRWARGASHGNELVFGMEVAVAGLLLVAGAAGVAPPSADATRDTLILKYPQASLPGTLIITLVLLVPAARRLPPCARLLPSDAPSLLSVRRGACPGMAR